SRARGTTPAAPPSCGPGGPARTATGWCPPTPARSSPASTSWRRPESSCATSSAASSTSPHGRRAAGGTGCAGSPARTPSNGGTGPRTASAAAPPSTTRPGRKAHQEGRGLRNEASDDAGFVGLTGLVLEQALVELAGGMARQLGAEIHASGALDIRQVLPAVGDELALQL